MSTPAVTSPTPPYQGVMMPPPKPQCPAGWRTGPPDFIGIGAQRAGSTRWFDLVVAHPQIQAPPATRKELHYFDRFHAGAFTAADAAAYSDWFPRPPGRLTGEWTPVYLAAPWAPAMLAAAAPDARLLVTLRDPVERYISGLQRHHRTAHASGEALNAMAPLEAFMRGFYHAQLTQLLGHFARAQVLILQYERCVREPLSELRRTFAFLGLDPAGHVPDLDAHPNRQPDKAAMHADARCALVDAYTPDVSALIGQFPEIDVALWPNFAHLG
jgi:hypothetical protein